MPSEHGHRRKSKITLLPIPLVQRQTLALFASDTGIENDTANIICLTSRSIRQVSIPSQFGNVGGLRCEP